jgi:guanosine-3',5'-bis(diphosphate) 3'-pyrophosphohydrolase
MRPRVMRQVELLEKVLAYDPSADEDLLNRAYVFSMKAHGAQKRASGDPYFSHPVEVAGILAGMKLDATAIATGLLHDTLEDTVATPDDIQKNFGADVLRLVDGVTKLSRIELQSDRTRQAENFRKLLLAMSSDIRVLLVKLADRLHNMRTLHFIKDPEKRRRIAKETMEIYVPLADRIGMQDLREELEDLAFAELNGDARASIIARLDQLRNESGSLVDRIVDRLKRTLAEQGVEAWVSGREKRPYSIWQKMQRKNIAFEQLSDIMAFRIVVADVAGCYHALGVVHQTWPSVPGRFKDYLSTPKQNGYRSLHTTVIGPENKRIEIQIRTNEMHTIADLGVAAHWQYKQNGGSHTSAPEAEARQYRWLRELLEILDQASDPEEFLEHTKLNMFQDQVFCFSPKGDLIALPRDATVVDFAYAVHSDVGDTAVGAKVNGRVVPLRTVLRNGDQVEILRSKVPAPNPTWLNFVKSGRAKSCINRFIRQQQRGQYHELGKAILTKAFKEHDSSATEKVLEPVVKVLKLRNADDVFVGVGEGNFTARQVINIVFPGQKEDEADKAPPLPRPHRQTTDHSKAGSGGIPIRGLIPGMAMHFAGCCHPLPGDRIVGIVTTGKGVTIHTIDCETLEQFAEQPERWLDLAWDPPSDGEKAHGHVGRVNLLINNEPGALSAVTTIIAKHKGNITNLKITNRTTDFFEMFVDIEVRDVKHLTNIIAALRATLRHQFGGTCPRLTS